MKLSLPKCTMLVPTIMRLSMEQWQFIMFGWTIGLHIAEGGSASHTTMDIVSGASDDT